MYLINISLMQLDLVQGDPSEPYVILSHTWNGNEELHHSEFSKLTASTKSGAHKIKVFCSLVVSKYCQKYGWVDTCCIDKKSSAELSEAINSMFAWYRMAEVCVVYLSDVTVSRDHQDFEQLFKDSRWFTRCWTLQELLGPVKVDFFNASWEFLGSKADHAELIHDRTRISPAVLRGEIEIYTYSVAQRMSWAANRRATRREDVAYSLLGLFDVNMPLLYGEGDKAFLRLQEEIAQSSDDETIFTWIWPEQGPVRDKLENHCGLLAPSPDCFVGCESICNTAFFQRGSSHEVRTGAIRFQAMLAAFVSTETQHYMAPLNACRRSQDSTKEHVVVLWLQLRDADCWTRTTHHHESITYEPLINTLSRSWSFKTVVVKHKQQLCIPSFTNPTGLNFGKCLRTVRKDCFLLNNIVQAKWTPKPSLRESSKSTAGEAPIFKDCIFGAETNPFGPMCNIYPGDYLKDIHCVQIGFDRAELVTCIVLTKQWWESANHPQGKTLSIWDIVTFEPSIYENIQAREFSPRGTYEEDARYVHRQLPGLPPAQPLILRGAIEHQISCSFSFLKESNSFSLRKTSPSYSIHIECKSGLPGTWAKRIWYLDLRID